MNAIGLRKQVPKHVDPIFDSIKAAADKLTDSTNFLRFLAPRALIMHEELPTPGEEQIDGKKYHFMSLVLNLANTFLYMVNTYIIVSTADDCFVSLEAATAVCGFMIGAMAIGNILYALAYNFNSMWVFLIGHLFCGMMPL
ncbi:hypothetical protein Nepgr_011284 [Nepenthes gracilis]|uniref:Uncharacterized protein n=1 Tax=Nepenthes gracilis TaxID=150966 RepID=A0AAD3SE15_NEPGR|nr:hypothetical protein Nepgr_011284 [Nepenthes gracilis]